MLNESDVLTAANALEHGLPLPTANFKHFSPVAGLSVERYVPV